MNGLIPVTADMIQRYQSGRLGFGDPCVVCGGTLILCGHDLNATEAVCKRIKKMTASQIKATLTQTTHVITGDEPTMATNKKSEEAATEEVKNETSLRNGLRNQAEREIIEAHRAEFDTRLESLYTANGLSFRKRLTQEERAAKQAAERLAKAKAKLDALLAENPELASELPGQTSIEDLQNTGGVGD